MPFDRSTTKKIAWLARLNIKEHEIANYSDDLNRILTLIEQMNTVDTAGISAVSHPLDLNARLRKDEVIQTNQRDYFQKQAPLTEDGHYLVPKVLK